MSAAERRRLFDKLAYTPDFLREIGYVVLLEEVDKLQWISPRMVDTQLRV